MQPTSRAGSYKREQAATSEFTAQEQVGQGTGERQRRRRTRAPHRQRVDERAPLRRVAGRHQAERGQQVRNLEVAARVLQEGVRAPVAERARRVQHAGPRGELADGARSVLERVVEAVGLRLARAPDLQTITRSSRSCQQHERC
jgi:hypothetical protein